MTLQAALLPLPPLPELAIRWRALEQRAQGCVFLGWTWMGSWLETSGATPRLLAVTQDGGDVALALVGRSGHRRLLGAVPTLWLNQAGDACADRPFIEYNGLLTASGAPDGVEAAAMDCLFAEPGWGALRLSGIAPDHPLLRQGRFRRRVEIDASPAWHVDLDAVRGANGDYLSLLSANTRSQIRRAARDYGAGDALVRVADADRVDAWLAEMRALNAGRHADNAWDDEAFVAFVRLLVVRGAAAGEVELLRVTHGEELLGLLVNLVHRGRAMNYQSAFAEPLSSRGKPGLLCHAAAVSRYASAGLSLYSLLAGKDRYKQSLSTGSETLQWWSLERFSPRLEGEALARRLLRRPVSA